MTNPVNIQRRQNQIASLPPLRDVIAAHDLSAQKALGQNFLLDINITDKIVREAMACDPESWENVHALEVGPGPGGLTRALLKSPVSQVTAIEFDTRAVLALQSLKECVQGDFDIIQGDALKLDLITLSSAPRVIVANLPYNIATPLLINWLKQIRRDHSAYQSMALMFQREVADRITADPKTKAYGRLSVIAQWLCRCIKIYDLPSSAFTPPPKVSSAVVHFVPIVLPDNSPSFETVERITAAAFNQRRKMIRSSLKEYLPVIEDLGIDPTIRAEALSVREYIHIAKCVEQKE